jgi:hypothetical protein
MPIWQFLVLTILLVGVLACAGAYARVLGRTLSRASARLKRIEEALVVANDRLLRRTESVTAEPSRANSVDKDSASYLSILDLKVISEPPSSTALQPVSEYCVASAAAVCDPVETGGEQSVTPVPDAASEPDNGSSNGPHRRDSVAKQNQDALLILSSQRRRRRARLGH